MERRGAITIKDIARMAGVSHSTVSRALNDNPHISPETSGKIKALAESLNFDFNAGARSLSSKRTGIIGVIYPSKLDAFGSSLYTNQLFLDLRHSLESYQLDSILLQPYNPATGNSNITRLIRQHKVDAFLIVHAGISREEYEAVRSNGLPLVQLHLRPVYYPEGELDLFLTDNVAGGSLACDHLVSEGCRRIMAITSCHQTETNPEFPDRVEGYRRSLERAGIDPDPSLVVDVGLPSFEAGYRIAKDCPDLFRGVDGLFVHADIIALGCLAGLKERGLSVPEDIKVVGFDDCSICEFCQPALSSVHQPREELAMRSCARLHELLGGSGGRVREILKPSLVVRGSSRTAR